MEYLDVTIEGNHAVIGYHEWMEETDHGKQYTKLRLFTVYLPWLADVELEISKGSDLEKVCVEAFEAHRESEKLEAMIRAKGEFGKKL